MLTPSGMIRSLATLAVLALAWGHCSIAVAQFGGGGFGGGGGGGLGGGGLEPLPEARQPGPDEEIIITSGTGRDASPPAMTIIVSPDRKEMWGYSSAKGEWKRQSVEAPLQREQGTPIVGTTVAVVLGRTKVYAFSSLKGEWSTLDLPADNEPFSGPTISYQTAELRTRNTLSIFSAQTANWATVKFKE